ncbi:MAG: SDR family oxidoreductase [Candidatus Diapherotrites archaeon]|nr:SDR family oxidoreductase [Candidatus Diapherotrites archaeon]
MYTEKEIDRRTGIVTGAAQGIGKEVAFALAKKGTNLILADTHTKKLKQAVKEIRLINENTIGIRTNVRMEQDVKRTTEKGLEKFGKIDFLINCAGIAVMKELKETGTKEFEKVLDTNLKGIFLFCKYVVPVMEQNKFGVIVNIASGLGKKGMKGFSAYSASKFGVIGLTESLADELKDKGIKVLAMCPGGVNTEMYKTVFKNYNPANLIRPEYIAQQVTKICYESYLVKTGSSLELY